VTDRLTPDALRARVRAAIGEPEMSGRGFDLGTARRRHREWRFQGWGVDPAPLRVAGMVALVSALVAVLTVALVVHLHSLPSPAGPSGGPVRSSTLQASATPGLPADGFVPSDVTAVSADEWWVLGTDGSGCAGASCTRILHTVDAGQTFTSIPTPPASVVGLRFLDSEDGWAYSSTTVWSTHDGGENWSGMDFGTSITDLETSGGLVYAVSCGSGSDCSLERSKASSDAWENLAIPAALMPSGATKPEAGSLNVHGSSVWLAFSNGEGDNRVLRSTDDGIQFSQATICPGDSGVASLYAVSTADLWAACSVGMYEEVWRSLDGGATFAAVPLSGDVETNSGTIAATSVSSAVVAGTSLKLTVDGGQSFQVVLDNGDNWRIVGFTTSDAGFAFGRQPGASSLTLWRTDDGGSTWHQVLFS